eukprot:TRINITY_DN1340_c0_g1_i2.p1 TRINITY_DN1340_c0_g1~~TRINITY_DN1340_c0_g1_i2.p1  ORF type:complete len:177 (+),score=15.55 TRINITY_DN1340_c0_g1_i2:37-567(+)
MSSHSFHSHSHSSHDLHGHEVQPLVYAGENQETPAQMLTQSMAIIQSVFEFALIPGCGFVYLLTPSTIVGITGSMYLGTKWEKTASLYFIGLLINLFAFLIDFMWILFVILAYQYQNTNPYTWILNDLNQGIQTYPGISILKICLVMPLRIYVCFLAYQVWKEMREKAEFLKHTRN